MFGVARNTVRRYTRQDATPCGPPTTPLFDVQDELDLARRIARHWHTPDPDELESELTLKLAEIQPKKTVVANWKAFVVTALNRAAFNWLRARHRREGRLAAFERLHPRPNGSEADAEDIAAFFDVRADDRLGRMRDVLSPFLRRVWDARVIENLNQTQAATRLHVHRNTIGNAERRIRTILKRHDF